MTECISVSGGIGMDLTGCPGSSLGQNVAGLDLFGSNSEDRQSPPSPLARSNSADGSSSGNSSRDSNNMSITKTTTTATTAAAATATTTTTSTTTAAAAAAAAATSHCKSLVDAKNAYDVFFADQGDTRPWEQPKEEQVRSDKTSSGSSSSKSSSSSNIKENYADDDDDYGGVDMLMMMRNTENNDSLDGSLEADSREGVCGVCSEAYSQPPRVLNCLHVFCEACLAKQQRPLSSSPNHGQATIGVICCPKCHTETECAQGLKSLPVDYVLINRLDAEAIRKRTVVCTSCKSEDHAIARCQDCSSFLCSSCEKAHSSMLCFENHHVVSFEAFDRESAQIHRAVSCLRHPREVAQLYDPTCGTAMCNECLVSGHQGHGCKKVNEFDAPERADLINIINEAKQKYNQFDETNELLTTSLSELQLTRDSVRSSIEETFITFKSILERAKDAALEDLERIHSAQEMSVMDDIQLCQETRVNLEHSLEFADKLAKYGDAAEFLALKVLVTSRIRKLVHACPMRHENRELKFFTDEAKFRAAVNGLFGRVVSVDPLDPNDRPDVRVGVSLLNTSIAPEIGNTSAARLLPTELVDAVNSSPISSNHFGQLENHHLLTQLQPINTNNGPPPVMVLDSMNNSNDGQFGDFRSALAQMNLARLAGMANVVEPEVEVPDVLPLLVGNEVVPSGHLIVGPDASRLASAAVASSDEEAQLINNLSALAKLANPGQYPGQTMQQRFRAAAVAAATAAPPPLSPTAMPQSLVVENGNMVSQASGSSSTSGTSAGGQRSPTTGALLQAPVLQGSVSRTNRMTPMHIRIKFGQLGSGQIQFSSPHGFCLGPNEEIVVADTNNHRIQIFDKGGEFKSEFGVQGKDEGQLWYPRKVAVMKSTGTYVICDRGNERSRMQLFTKGGEFIKKIAIRYIDIVAGLALTSDGRIVAVDSVSPTVFVIAEGGDLLLWFDCSEHMREPSDIAVWGSEFYICDFKGHCVVVYSECGNFLRRIGGENLTNFPNGIDVSDHGDILVGDSHGNRFHIVVFNREGQAVSEFECPYCKVSRCCGLKITSEGYVVTLAKNNHHVLILNTLYVN